MKMTIEEFNATVMLKDMSPSGLPSALPYMPPVDGCTCAFCERLRSESAMASDMPRGGPPQMFGDSMGSANRQQEVGEQLMGGADIGWPTGMQAHKAHIAEQQRINDEATGVMERLRTDGNWEVREIGDMSKGPGVTVVTHQDFGFGMIKLDKPIVIKNGAPAPTFPVESLTVELPSPPLDKDSLPYLNAYGMLTRLLDSKDYIDDPMAFAQDLIDHVESLRDRVDAASANQSKSVPPTPYKALRALSQAMQADPSYAWAWQSRLAMMAQDAGSPHIEANVRAADFMDSLFGVKVSEFPEFKAIVGGVERSTMRTADGREVDVVLWGGKR